MAEQRQQLFERGTILEAAHVQVRQLQEKLAEEENRLGRRTEEIDTQARQLTQGLEELESV